MWRQIGWTAAMVVALACLCCVMRGQQASGGNTGTKSGSKKGGSTKGGGGKNPSGSNTTTGGTDPGPAASPAPTTTPSPKPATTPGAPATGDTATGGQKGGTDSGGASVCRSVDLGPQGDPASLQGQLDGVGGVSVKLAGDHAFVLCGPPANVDVLEEASRNISASGTHARGHETHLVRLFYFRDGKSIADAINNAGGLGTPVKAMGLGPDSKAQDLLIFTSESAADDRAIHELKRWIAMIDVPKPQVTFNAWSIQISSPKLEAIQFQSTNIKTMVSTFNQELQDALQQGWHYLDQQQTVFQDQMFVDYLTRRYVRRPIDLPVCERETPGSQCPETAWRNLQERCTEDEYCLGYARMFSPLQPSLTSMLIALIAAQKPGDVANHFVDCLESVSDCPAPIQSKLQAASLDKNTAASLKNLMQNSGYSAVVPGDCQRKDSEQYGALGALHPRFNCFRQQLNASLGYPASHTLLKMALADFLFHYKTTELYPQDYIPWNRGASAQRLDNLFNPLLVEFNRDLTVYLSLLTLKVAQKRTSDKNVDYSSEGAVTVSVLSGSPANVSTRTQSFFTVPPVLSAAQFLQAAKDTGTTNFSALLSNNLTAEAAQSLIALTQSVQSKTAQVGRDLNLNVTANSLSGASSAELDVQLDSTEVGDPKYLDDKNASSNDNVSRVASHKTTTKVRVDSLKLFEVSSFSAILTHGRSVPLLPPFIDLPYLGNLARLRLPPGTVYHRSFAIVSAVIVPTAADIANAIEFRSDLEATTLPKAEWLHAPAPTKDAKPKPDNTQTNTTTVQVQQSGGTAGPVSVQVGACPTCPPAPKPTPTPTPTPSPVSTPSPTPQPTPSGYYWVVSHYREGVSVSAPEEAKAFAPAPPTTASTDASAGKTTTHPTAVNLAWEAPANALSFDIYWISAENFQRSQGRSGNGQLLEEFPDLTVLVTRTSTRGRTFKDDGTTTWRMNDADRKTPLLPVPLDTLIYSAIPTLPGNLNEFHNAKLDCFKGDPDDRPPCSAKLSTAPTTRFYLTH